MDPNFKLLFDELAKLNRRFDEQDESWNRRFKDLEQGITERLSSTSAHIEALEATGSATARRHGPPRHP